MFTMTIVFIYDAASLEY